ncbi:MAG TPA: DUF305 domain-containing protein [Gemmatimonadaceae bacterium]|nr:DUF305 domain-containing protein [Gemmatimonadaceae bacterium]
MAAALLLGVVSAVSAQAPALPPVHSDSASIAQARADSLRRPYTAADVAFMTGMIAHHAQAVVMARWAPTHGASDDVRTLCARIINAQQDEIRIMQQWLADRHQPVPHPNFDAIAARADTGMSMASMPGMPAGGSGANHETLMPGMLTPAQLDTLDHARGPDFDLTFLRGMIQHHRGAIDMVKTLFSTPGAGQDELTFKLASDINVDQTTEIARMQKMLIRTTLGIGSP